MANEIQEFFLGQNEQEIFMHLASMIKFTEQRQGMKLTEVWSLTAFSQTTTATCFGATENRKGHTITRSLVFMEYYQQRIIQNK